MVTNNPNLKSHKIRLKSPQVIQNCGKWLRTMYKSTRQLDAKNCAISCISQINFSFMHLRFELLLLLCDFEFFIVQHLK